MHCEVGITKPRAAKLSASAMGRPRKIHRGDVRLVQFSSAAIHGAAAMAGPASTSAAAAAQEEARSQPQVAGLSRMPDAHDSDEDDEAAEFRREAAELLKQTQRQHFLPGGLQQQQLEGAIKHFVRQTGLSKEEAEDALLATAEQHCKDFEEWINEAMVWLAVQGEVQDEAAKLKQAMEVSLREQEAMRQAEQQGGPPLTNLSEERLRKRFHGSPVLQQLIHLVPSSVLFCDRPPVREQVKHKLVEFLRLEADCLKWWPSSGTKAYFNALAERFCTELRAAGSTYSTRGLHPTAGTTAAAAAAAADAFASAEAEAAAAAAPTPVLQLQAPQQEQPASLQQQQLQALAPCTHVPGATGGCAGVAAACGAAGAAGCTIRPSGAEGVGPPPAGVAAAGVACGVGGSISGQSPDSGAVQEPCSTSGTDMTSDDGASCGIAAAVRCSKRKRQPPARFRTPSPAPADACKRQHGAVPGSQQPSKRHVPAALVVKADAAPGASVSPPPAAAESALQPGLAAAAADDPAAASAAPSAPCGLPRQGDSLPEQQQQQQQGPTELLLGAAGQPAVAACLSRLLQDELQQLKHHVYTMPEKACAVPAVFQLAEERQEEEEAGDSSDVELVDVKQPVDAADMWDAPESPQSPAAPPAEAAAAAAAAAAAVPPPASKAGAAAAPGPCASLQLPQGSVVLPGDAAMGLPLPLAGWQLAALAAPGGAAAAGPELQLSALAGLQMLSMPVPVMRSPHAGATYDGGAAATAAAAVEAEQFQYRSTTTEQGTLVIEID